MEPIILAGDITNWIDDTTAWLSNTLPVLFLAVVVAIGLYLLVVTRGGIRKVLVFGVGAAVVFMVLTNVDNIADMFGTELGAPAPGRPPVVVVTDSGTAL